MTCGQENRYWLLFGLTCCLAFFSAALSAQSFFKDEKTQWLRKAEAFKPLLYERQAVPLGLVVLLKDPTAFQDIRAVYAGTMDSLYQSSIKQKTGAVVDFGEHLTGYFSFSLKPIKGTPDAPVRLKFTFGEVPAETAHSFTEFRGELSRAWLQDEVVTVFNMPCTIELPRRLSFRYVKVELLGASQWFDFALSGMQVRTVTSAHTRPAPLLSTASHLIKKIDSVGLNTLKECMQTVFEDGPKRDQRLWLGDLYLQSLANEVSFRADSLTRRSLYLAAGLCDSAGYLPSNVFESPAPHAQQGAHIIEYSLLFNATLADYLQATGDRQTAGELWPVARRQIEYLSQFVKTNGAFDYAAASKSGGAFIDWRTGLDKETSVQAAFIFAINKTAQLAAVLNRKHESKAWTPLKKKLADYLLKNAFDKRRLLFTSGPQRQVSYASQIWVVLAGILPQQKEKALLQNLAKDTAAVRPFTPYLFSYYIEALLQASMPAEAKEQLEEYWGAMVAKGADTFWEVADPADDFASPYNYFPLNSYCHAWSCTPVYFIRKYPNVFQQ